MKMKYYSRVPALLLALLTLASLASCGSVKTTEDDAYYDAPGDYDGYPKSPESSDYAYKDSDEAGPDVAFGDSTASVAAEATRKRIQNITVVMESTEYDTALALLKSRTAALGGYIESSKELGGGIYDRRSRYATLVLRIPAEATEEFTSGIGSIANILSFDTDSKDVTEVYYDTEARVEALRIERERYLELLEKADSMTNIITLNEAISRVTYQIESLTGTLRKYDALVAYSTVTVTLEEVEVITETPGDTFGARIKAAFADSIEALAAFGQWIVVAFVTVAPFAVIPAVIAVIAVIISRKKKK